MLPLFAGRNEFYQRVRRGYQLGQLGVDTEQIIEHLNLKQAVIEIFQQKASVGQFAHGNYCRLQGRSVNEWLAQPERIADFLQALQESHWITRHQNPEESRFWKLISGDKAVMFGVFIQAEQQIIYDWIAGRWLAENAPRPRRYRAVHGNAQQNPAENISLSVQQALNSKQADLAHLAQKLLEDDRRAQALDMLIPYLSPAVHSSKVGLWATQQFLRLLNQGIDLPLKS